MTSPAIKLARELCLCAVVDGRIVPAMPSEGLFIRQLEAFYRRAQVQALRDAAESVTLIAPELQADDRYYFREQLRRKADELERKA